MFNAVRRCGRGPGFDGLSVYVQKGKLRALNLCLVGGIGLGDIDLGVIVGSFDLSEDDRCVLVFIGELNGVGRLIE